MKTAVILHCKVLAVIGCVQTNVNVREFIERDFSSSSVPQDVSGSFPSSMIPNAIPFPRVPIGASFERGCSDLEQQGEEGDLI